MPAAAGRQQQRRSGLLACRLQKRHATSTCSTSSSFNQLPASSPVPLPLKPKMRSARAPTSGAAQAATAPCMGDSRQQAVSGRQQACAVPMRVDAAACDASAGWLAGVTRLSCNAMAGCSCPPRSSGRRRRPGCAGRVAQFLRRAAGSRLVNWQDAALGELVCEHGCGKQYSWTAASPANTGLLHAGAANRVEERETQDQRWPAIPQRPAAPASHAAGHRVKTHLARI